MTQGGQGGDAVTDLTLKLDGTFEGQKVTLENAPLDTVTQALEALRTFVRATSDRASTASVGFGSGSLAIHPQLPPDSAVVFQTSLAMESFSEGDAYLELMGSLQKALRERDLYFAVMLGEREALRVKSDGVLLNVVEESWLETTTTVFGQLIDLGGKKPNIHVETEEYGKLRIDATRDQIRRLQAYTFYNFSIQCQILLQDLPVYRDCRLRDFTKAHGDIGIQEAIQLESPRWKDVGDVSAWVRSIRGSQ